MSNAVTESDLYAIGMESETADKLMPQLCAALGIDYPPQIERHENRQDIPDPFKTNFMGIPATL